MGHLATASSDRLILQVWRCIPRGRRALIRAVLHFNDMAVFPHVEEFGFFKNEAGIMGVFNPSESDSTWRHAQDRYDAVAVAAQLDRLCEMAEVAVAPQARVRFQMLSLESCAPDAPVIISEITWFEVVENPSGLGLIVRPMAAGAAAVEEILLEGGRDRVPGPATVSSFQQRQTARGAGRLQASA